MGKWEDRIVNDILQRRKEANETPLLNITYNNGEYQGICLDLNFHNTVYTGRYIQNVVRRMCQKLNKNPSEVDVAEFHFHKGFIRKRVGSDYV